MGETFSSTSMEGCPWDSANGWNNCLLHPPQVDGWALVYPIVPISIGDWGWGGGLFKPPALNRGGDFVLNYTR